MPVLPHPMNFDRPDISQREFPHIYLIDIDLFCRWYVSTVMFGYYFNPTVYPTIQTPTDARNITNATIWLPQGERFPFSVGNPTFIIIRKKIKRQKSFKIIWLFGYLFINLKYE